MPESILRERRGTVFGSVILEKFIRSLLDRFPLLLQGFLFDDLAVTPLQTLTLAALLRDRLGLAGGTGGTPVTAPVQLELVMVEPAILENAHLLALVFRTNLTLPPFVTSVAETVKSKIGAAGPFRALVDGRALWRHRRPVAIPERR
jgi:hypothetical protein